MKKGLILFFQGVVVLLGIGTLVFLLWMPNVEGRNVDSTLFEVYFKDPFLAFAYLGSVAYFIGVYKVFKVLGYAKENMLNTVSTVKALRVIKYCALVVIGFVVAGEIYIITSIVEDDKTGGIAMGLFIILGSVVVAFVSAMLERKYKRNLIE